MNEAFGVFQMNMGLTQLRTLPLDYVGGPPGGRPLYQRALADPTLRAEYIDALCDLVRNGVDTIAIRVKADSLRAVIDEAVLTDTHKFFTYQQFNQNREQDVNQTPGVLSFLRDRIDFLDAALVAEGCVTAIPEITDGSGLSVWPIPADDVVNVRATKPISASLFDTQGRVLSRSGGLSSEPTVTTGSLPSGMYLLVISDASGTRSAQQRVQILH
ncbi:MAG: T9SS type A sorting domain-containing protein [Flavobacteriales bacterium]|nr:T9SS type A sorting domain-containing protein [Flavobacteriales bacterium]